MERDWRTGLEVLDEAQCWEFLRGSEIGRLALVAGGRPELLPMNYAVDGDVVRFRTEPGAKLASLTAAPVEAVLEVDSVSEQFRLGWSVLVRGTLRVVTGAGETARCELLHLQAWSDTPRPVWLTLDPAEVTGRRIARGPQEFTD